MGCGHKSNKSQQFCHRFGEYIPELGVRISVHLNHAWWWSASCNACPEFHPTSTIQDDVLAEAMNHHKIDHPRDLVAFLVHD